MEYSLCQLRAAHTAAQPAQSIAVGAIGNTVAWAAGNTVAQPAHRTAVQEAGSIVAQLAAGSMLAQLVANEPAAHADYIHRLVCLVFGGDSFQQLGGCFLVSKD